MLRFYRPIIGADGAYGPCNEPNLHLKLLYTNGSLLPLNVREFSPSAYNFCRSNGTDIRSFDYIQVTNLGMPSYSFYILYYNISDDKSLPFGRFILESDIEGNKIK